MQHWLSSVLQLRSKCEIQLRCDIARVARCCCARCQCPRWCYLHTDLGMFNIEMAFSCGSNYSDRKQVIGVGGNSCTAQPVCCQNNTFSEFPLLLRSSVCWWHVLQTALSHLGVPRLTSVSNRYPPFNLPRWTWRELGFLWILLALRVVCCWVLIIWTIPSLHPSHSFSFGFPYSRSIGFFDRLVVFFLN